MEKECPSGSLVPGTAFCHSDIPSETANMVFVRISGKKHALKAKVTSDYVYPRLKDLGIMRLRRLETKTDYYGFTNHDQIQKKYTNLFLQQIHLLF